MSVLLLDHKAMAMTYELRIKHVKRIQGFELLCRGHVQYIDGMYS